MSSYDVEAIRKFFPAVNNMLYLDAAHQTPLSIPVKAELDKFYEGALNYAGPKYGWLNRIEAVRGQLANFLGAEPNQIAFTKNTSEGLNICAGGFRWEKGDNVLILDTEHPHNAYSWLAKREQGLEVRLIPCDKKWADADTFRPYIDERTRAISISHIMFHSGQRNDMESLIQLGKAKNIQIFADSMQSVGVFPINLKKTPLFALASGTHKGLLTPQGLGFIYTAQPVEVFKPTYLSTAGVANARSDLRPSDAPIELRTDASRFEIGNYNLPAIHALGGALDLIEGIGLENIQRHVLGLGQKLIDLSDELGIDVVSPREDQFRSHISVLDLKEPEWAGFFKDQNVRLSPVRDGIRASFGIYSTESDIGRLGDVLRKGLKSIRRQAA